MNFNQKDDVLGILAFIHIGYKLFSTKITRQNKITFIKNISFNFAIKGIDFFEN